MRKVKTLAEYFPEEEMIRMSGMSLDEVADALWRRHGRRWSRERVRQLYAQRGIERELSPRVVTRAEVVAVYPKYTQVEAAKRLGICTQTLCYLLAAYRIPKAKRVGRDKILLTRSQIEAVYPKYTLEVAADLLGVHWHTLRRNMEEYSIPSCGGHRKGSKFGPIDKAKALSLYNEGKTFREVGDFFSKEGEEISESLVRYWILRESERTGIPIRPISWRTPTFMTFPCKYCGGLHLVSRGKHKYLKMDGTFTVTNAYFCTVCNVHQSIRVGE
jgi:predicted DNA-binding protein (UPF0251 family)